MQLAAKSQILMQSTFCPHSNASQFQFQWKKSQFFCITTTKTPNFYPPRTLTKSLHTSINYEPEGGLDDCLSPLPVVIKRSGKVSRYFWDGNSVQLVSVDAGASEFSLRNVLGDSSLSVRNVFIPKQVNENYMGFVKWKLIHRVFSSALQVLATQAMFRAMGFGHARSSPLAAAVNWGSKEVLGRLIRCVYTASMASAFDTNLKRVRFTTSVLFSLSIGLELLTPAFPRYFLLLACVANIPKQISLACYLATSSAVNRSFAIADNLGEVSAKAQIQSNCFDGLGLMVAALLNVLVRNNQWLQAGLPFVVYPFFAALDLFGLYQGLKHVHLQTLTKDRLEIILDAWIMNKEDGEEICVPSPAEVSKEEGIDFLWSNSKESWPIRIGYLNPNSKISKSSMMAMRSLSDKDYYFISMESFPRRWRKTEGHGILLFLREGASTADIIMGLLQACYVRKNLISSDKLENIVACKMLDLSLKNFLSLIEDGRRCAEDDFSELHKQLSERGWAVKNILLNTSEQEPYSFLDK